MGNKSVTMRLPDDLLEQVEAYQKDQGLETRTDAFIQLVLQALGTEPSMTDENSPDVRQIQGLIQDALAPLQKQVDELRSELGKFVA